MINGTRVFYVRRNSECGYPEAVEEVRDWHWFEADPDLYYSVADCLELRQDPETGCLYWSDGKDFREPSERQAGKPPAMTEVVAILGNYNAYLGQDVGIESLALVYNPKTIAA